MRLIRGVEHAATNLGAEVALPGADDGVEGGHRAAGGEQAARLRRKSHPVAQPVERVGLELHQRRRRLPHAGVAVGGVGDEVGERRRVEPAAGDVGEIAGARRGERARNPVAEQAVEQRLERDAVTPARARASRGTARRRRHRRRPVGDRATAMCATQRATTSSAIARMRSGENSRSTAANPSPGSRRRPAAGTTDCRSTAGIAGKRSSNSGCSIGSPAIRRAICSPR